MDFWLTKKRTTMETIGRTQKLGGSSEFGQSESVPELYTLHMF